MGVQVFLKEIFYKKYQIYLDVGWGKYNPIYKIQIQIIWGNFLNKKQKHVTGLAVLYKFKFKGNSNLNEITKNSYWQNLFFFFKFGDLLFKVGNLSYESGHPLTHFGNKKVNILCFSYMGIDMLIINYSKLVICYKIW